MCKMSVGKYIQNGMRVMEDMWVVQLKSKQGSERELYPIFEENFSSVKDQFWSFCQQYAFELSEVYALGAEIV